MKTCQRNREQIARLAMEDLEATNNQELRAHLESCAACRRYFEEISNVVGTLRAAESSPEGQPSASFHRNLTRALAEAKRKPVLETIAARIWDILNWRLAASTAVTAALAMALWFLMGPPFQISRPARISPDSVADHRCKLNLEPTFANYEMAVHQSLDKLDDLLTEQGNRNPGPPSAYLAGRLTKPDLAD